MVPRGLRGGDLLIQPRDPPLHPDGLRLVHIERGDRLLLPASERLPIALEPLDTYVRASAIVRADDYFSGIWDTNRIDDALYGVPWYVDTRLVFYRRDRLSRAGFSAPPVSWAQWKRVLAALQEEGGRDRYAILLPLNEVEPLTLGARELVGGGA